jgi:DNA-binding LytR/AlgR family response regulator
MEQATEGSVQPRRDGWSFGRDESQSVGPDGAQNAANGRCVSIRAIYIGIAIIVAAYGLVNALSVAYDLTRLGRPYRFWQPLVWEATSATLVIALLALPRHAAKLAAGIASRPLSSGFLLIGLALAFSALHIGGMVLLREFAYAVAGTAYSFDWSASEVLYELRKDLLSFSTLAITFWLAERAFGRPRPSAPTAVRRSEASADASSIEATAGSPLWLRDGRRSILVNAGDILYVTSAGNYVEYVMATGQRHLIRTTLQAEAARLSRFGIARVHRTRLVNVKRIVAVAWGASGDFDLRLDNGETIAGSRRCKAAVAGIGA